MHGVGGGGGGGGNTFFAENMRGRTPNVHGAEARARFAKQKHMFSVFFVMVCIANMHWESVNGRNSCWFMSVGYSFAAETYLFLGVKCLLKNTWFQTSLWNQPFLEPDCGYHLHSEPGSGYLAHGVLGGPGQGQS